jgi:arabinoxylan arabinofuranohydrolase
MLRTGSEEWWQTLQGPQCRAVDGAIEVTFWWRDPAGDETHSPRRRVWLYITGVTDHHQNARPQSLQRLPGTDAWFWRTTLSPTWRGSYCFIPSDRDDDFSPEVFSADAPDRALLREGWRKLLPRAIADPLNPEGKMCLYAPDVTVGPDGRYYLYYVLDKVSVVSVAVCDTPAGKYEFYGYVHYEDGTRLGEKEGDEPQFDPGVLTEGDVTYLYTGFCGKGDKSRTGAMATVLGADMLTIREAPVFVAPGCEYGAGTGFEGHEFFEAPSIRKVGDTYYFVYSSILMHELCYATSKNPTRDFVYGGVIVSNCDLHIDTYKPADMPTAYGANNHGSIVQIGEDWYIFYHRHTNNTYYSRQGCAEKLQIMPDGSIPQVEITSCGLNGGPLEGKGEYPAYLACNLFTDTPSVYVGEGNFPRVMQDGRDGDEEVGYIANITDSTTIGFKYFDCHDIREISIWVRGYADGTFEVKTAWDGEVLATLEVQYTNVWEKYTALVTIPDGIQALYLTYRGNGNAALRSFELS